jgi:predicted HicB family RNase H-like nuclease
MTLQLLQAEVSPAPVLNKLMSRYGLSRRQAYRYLELAREATAPVPVPEEQRVFSVKLSRRLIAQVRHQAKRERCALNQWVDRVLRQALKPQAPHG